MFGHSRYMLENGSLAFDKVVHEKGGDSDKGEYQCLATVDGLGTIVSRMATLDVACELGIGCSLFLIWSMAFFRGWQLTGFVRPEQSRL